jgi:hypothetical protein
VLGRREQRNLAILESIFYQPTPVKSAKIDFTSNIKKMILEVFVRIHISRNVKILWGRFQNIGVLKIHG